MTHPRFFLQRHARWLCALALVLAVARPLAAAPDFLADARWAVKITPDKAAAGKGEKEYDDQLSFKAGQFASVTFKGRGFSPAAYKGETEVNEAEFEVEQRNGAGETANWLGEIRGKVIVGQLQWQKSDGTIVLFNFKGLRE